MYGYCYNPIFPVDYTMTLETVVQLSQIAAFLAATAFFVYKLIVGYFVPNLSLMPKITRRGQTDNTNDILIVELTVAKGEIGSVNIHDIKARLNYGEEQKVIEFIGAERLSFNTDKNSGKFDRKLIAWDRISKKNPFLRMGPGESTIFSAYAEVPKDQITKIDIVVLGRKPRSWFVGHWRTSAVSAMNDVNL